MIVENGILYSVFEGEDKSFRVKKYEGLENKVILSVVKDYIISDGVDSTDVNILIVNKDNQVLDFTETISLNIQGQDVLVNIKNGQGVIGITADSLGEILVYTMIPSIMNDWVTIKVREGG